MIIKKTCKFCDGTGEEKNFIYLAGHGVDQLKCPECKGEGSFEIEDPSQLWKASEVYICYECLSGHPDGPFRCSKVRCIFFRHGRETLFENIKKQTALIETGEFSEELT